MSRPRTVKFPTSFSPEARALLASLKARHVVPREAFKGDLRAGKNTEAYRAHSYHTKVPPEAIRRLIEHHTHPGSIVLDPFCGSGMTGLAALQAGRHAVLNDLSPAAVHIARNYTRACAPDSLATAFQRLEATVGKQINALYEYRSGDRARIEYTVWSDVFECSSCRKRLVYWDAARDRTGRIAEFVRCRSCGARHQKRDLRWLGEKPVEVDVLTSAGERERRDGGRRDTALIQRIESAPLPFWLPDVPFDDRREMWRAAHADSGIKSVADFYTRRNLRALAMLRAAILEERDERLRDALMFAFTAIVNRASKRYQWNAKRPTNVMAGTLYVSSLRYEWNVWSLFTRKVADIRRHYESLGEPATSCHVRLGSATQLDIEDASIDYVFMDPPFGSNIFYADCSLLWEAWLGTLTDDRQEMVVHRHRSPSEGGKTLGDYRDLMAAAFTEVRRVLKPSAFATLAFNNTDDEVWCALQEALADARLDVVETSGLDKIHPSIKGVKGRQQKEAVASFDVLLSLRAASTRYKVGAAPSRSELQSAVERHLTVERASTTDHVFSSVVRHVLRGNRSLSGITMEAVEEISREIARQRDGRWTLRDGDAPKYGAVDSPYGCVAIEYCGDPRKVISSDDERRSPKSVETTAPSEVNGSRNTDLYNAHSYHTKVPPEAIIPFLEHFTRPGDVVLDPFSGSGMTGVAAVQTGRRAILNDLSVAAAHLGFNHTRPCDPEALRRDFEVLYAQLRQEFAELYGTADRGYVQFTLWSRDAVCRSCASEFSVWDVIDRANGTMPRNITCGRCGTILAKQGLRYTGNRPVLINYVDSSGKRRERGPTPEEERHAVAYSRQDIAAWYPKVPLGPDREMYRRSALQLVGIHAVADFYTARNLHALSRLWQEIRRVRDDRVRQALSFAFTNTAWHGTRMRRFNARGGQRPLTGTLYVPQISSEVNVLEVLRHKVKQLCSYYGSYRPQATTLPVITIGSATDLAMIPNASVDYVFTDPPFGSNIFYADCNLIWESWLGGLTRTADEAVVNKSLDPESGGKTIADYGRLMEGSLREMNRVLKPGGWVTLVFHNTDPEVWRALQVAATNSGFEIDQAASLNRKEQSHKGYKGRAGEENVAHFDVVMSMRKSVDAQAPRQRRPMDELTLHAVLRKLQAELPADKQSVQHLHSAVLRHLAANGYDLGSVSFQLVREMTGHTSAPRVARKRPRP